MIPINENFEKAYKDSMAKGFTVKELFAVFSAAASLAVVCVVCFFVLHWNLYLSFFLGLPPAAVMILIGFWRSASDLTVKEAYDARRYRKRQSCCAISRRNMNENWICIRRFWKR